MSVDISVIIPLYNKEAYIERTLRSVSMQDIDNWECIIIDDGSTDSSLEKASNFIKAHPGNWKVVKQENSGQTSARNHGVKLALGRYLAFLDADDLWPKTKLRSQFVALETNPGANLVLSAFVIFRNHFSTPRIVCHKNSKRMIRRWLLMTGFGGGLESVGMIRKNSLLSGEMFDPTLSTSSGLDLSLRLAESGQIILLPEIGLYYRINPGQWHADTDELNKNLKILSERYQSKFGKDLAKSHAAYLFWISARGFGKKYLLHSLLQSSTNVKNQRLGVLMNLISRNITSFLRGKLRVRETLPTIKLLDA